MKLDFDEIAKLIKYHQTQLSMLRERRTKVIQDVNMNKINRRDYVRAKKIDRTIQDPFLECTYRHCKWIGKENEKKQQPYGDGIQTSHVCPVCEKEEFYTLIPRK